MSRQYVHEENITIPQGTDFIDTISISQKNGDAMDLSGISSFVGKMRTSHAYFTTTGTDMTISVNDAVNGVVNVEFTSSATASLKPGFYVYDINGFTSSGSYWRIAEGKINLTGRVY